MAAAIQPTGKINAGHRHNDYIGLRHFCAQRLGEFSVRSRVPNPPKQLIFF
jgi:hypothetical protein